MIRRIPLPLLPNGRKNSKKDANEQRPDTIANTSPKSLRIAIDAMGGDQAPRVVINGLSNAMRTNPDIDPILVGDRNLISPLIEKHPNLAGTRIVHTTDAVAADEKPSQALRNGKNTSMRLAIDMVGAGEADAVVSAGNSGALMVMALMGLRTMEGIDRPALAAYVPTEEKPCCILDLGANIDCSTRHLVQFAIMGDAFARVTSGRPSPSIGLLNVGEEEQKGSTKVRDAATILSNPEVKLNYAGFVEGDDFTRGTVDVIVTDGFSGNIALKTAEGTAKFVTTMMRRSFKSSLLSRLGYLLARQSLKELRHKLNPQTYNGAVLLGLNGIVVKSHGSADAKGFANAIGAAVTMIRQDFMSDLKQSVERSVMAIETLQKDED